MKRMIGLVALLAAGALHAQETAYYKKLWYRQDDPFLFCTRGMDILDPCWVPIAPYTGQYVETGVCDPPNEEGRPWTADDHFALKQLQEICPHAQESGKWNGAGDGSTSPFKH